MTDSFVPDKPGVYWYWNYAGTPDQTPAVINVLLVPGRPYRPGPTWTGGPYPDLFAREVTDWQLYGIDQFDWIGPATPPDVVDGLVKALETLTADLDKLRDDSNGPMANPYRAAMTPEGKAMRDHHDAARAAIQRYRGKL